MSLILDLITKSNIDLLDVASDFPVKRSFFFLLQSVTCDPQRVFKVVFLGNSAVGKSSFIHHYCSGHFPNNMASTVGETLDLCLIMLSLNVKAFYVLTSHVMFDWQEWIFRLGAWCLIPHQSLCSCGTPQDRRGQMSQKRLYRTKYSDLKKLPCKMNLTKMFLVR